MANNGGGAAPKKTFTHWESGDERDDIDPAVIGDLLEDGQIQLRLSPLAASRLLLSLGVGTRGHVKEVADVMTAISLLTTGVMPGAQTEYRRPGTGLAQDVLVLQNRVGRAIEKIGQHEQRLQVLEEGNSDAG